ncbi:Sugar and other transporter [Aspergillus sp. HF37]|nr:Sugar and other transporter [Aspergillus sp. HF37]
MKSYVGLRGNALSHAALWLVVCPAFVCYGYNMSVAGGLLTLPSFNEVFPSMDTINTEGATQAHNAKIQGTVIALYTVGGIFGSLACIYLGDIWGRRKTIFITQGVSIVGAILMATSFDLPQFIVARLVLGLGTGGYVATVPVWQSEITKASKRGAHVVTDGIYIGGGVALALWVDFGFYFKPHSSVSWRFPFAFQIVLSLTSMLFITLLPESPRWLMKVDRQEEAREILGALADLDPHDETINHQMREIEAGLAVASSGSFMDMFTMGESRLFHRAYLAATGQMFQQMCGINVITYYATTIFEQYLGMSPIIARVLAACMAMTQLFGGYLAFFTIDSLGRRILMLGSAGVMCIAMAVLAGTTSTEGNTAALAIAVVALFVFQFTFTIGFSGLTFLYATEMAPLQIRAAVSAVSTATVWVFNFLLAQVTPVGFNTIKNRFYIVFAVTNFCIVPTVYFFFPETKGRTLEEINEIFVRSKSIFDPTRVARNLNKVTIGESGSDTEQGMQSPKADEKAED